MKRVESTATTASTSTSTSGLTTVGPSIAQTDKKRKREKDLEVSSQEKVKEKEVDDKHKGKGKAPEKAIGESAPASKKARLEGPSTPATSATTAAQIITQVTQPTSSAPLTVGRTQVPSASSASIAVPAKQTTVTNTEPLKLKPSPLVPTEAPIMTETTRRPTSPKLAPALVSPSKAAPLRPPSPNLPPLPPPLPAAGSYVQVYFPGSSVTNGVTQASTASQPSASKSDEPSTTPKETRPSRASDDDHNLQHNAEFMPFQPSDVLSQTAVASPPTTNANPATVPLASAVSYPASLSHPVLSEENMRRLKEAAEREVKAQALKIQREKTAAANLQKRQEREAKKRPNPSIVYGHSYPAAMSSPRMVAEQALADAIYAEEFASKNLKWFKNKEGTPMHEWHVKALETAKQKREAAEMVVRGLPGEPEQKDLGEPVYVSHGSTSRSEPSTASATPAATSGKGKEKDVSSNPRDVDMWDATEDAGSPAVAAGLTPAHPALPKESPEAPSANEVPLAVSLSSTTTPTSAPAGPVMESGPLPTVTVTPAQSSVPAPPPSTISSYPFSVPIYVDLPVIGNRSPEAMDVDVDWDSFLKDYSDQEDHTPQGVETAKSGTDAPVPLLVPSPAAAPAPAPVEPQATVPEAVPVKLPEAQPIVQTRPTQHASTPPSHSPAPVLPTARRTLEARSERIASVLELVYNRFGSQVEANQTQVPVVEKAVPPKPTRNLADAVTQTDAATEPIAPPSRVVEMQKDDERVLVDSGVQSESATESAHVADKISCDMGVQTVAPMLTAPTVIDLEKDDQTAQNVRPAPNGIVSEPQVIADVPLMSSPTVQAMNQILSPLQPLPPPLTTNSIASFVTASSATTFQPPEQRAHHHDVAPSPQLGAGGFTPSISTPFHRGRSFRSRAPTAPLTMSMGPPHAIRHHSSSSVSAGPSASLRAASHGVSTNPAAKAVLSMMRNMADLIELTGGAGGYEDAQMEVDEDEGNDIWRARSVGKGKQRAYDEDDEAEEERARSSQFHHREGTERLSVAPDGHSTPVPPSYDALLGQMRDMQNEVARLRISQSKYQTRERERELDRYRPRHYSPERRRWSYRSPSRRRSRTRSRSPVRAHARRRSRHRSRSPYRRERSKSRSRSRSRSKSKTRRRKYEEMSEVETLKKRLAALEREHSARGSSLIFSLDLFYSYTHNLVASSTPRSESVGDYHSQPSAASQAANLSPLSRSQFLLPQPRSIVEHQVVPAMPLPVKTQRKLQNAPNKGNGSWKQATPGPSTGGGDAHTGQTS
ncbi:hypothetical protein BJ165DRAFT_665919 [Panaeolus papilionaceus]|nr:hypothetical protein BJ165DRAFT_665919 [Panaeolus papilionaceus]